MYDAVIFDNDGVLIEPTDYDVIAESVRETFRELGVSDPDDDDVDALFHVDRETVERVCASYGLDAPEFWAARDRNSSQAQQREIREGRKALYDDVEAIHALERDLAIVSNNQHETIEYIVDHFDLGDHFEVAYGREPHIEGIERKKPNTYYLEAALDDVGADDPLYVGDSDVDVAVARRLGIDSAFIRRPHRADHDLAYEPTYEIETLDDLPPLVDGATRRSRQRPNFGPSQP